MKKTEEIQATRIGLARRLMGEGLYARVTGWLKLKGYDLGTREIQREASAQKDAMARFEKTAYPAMRYEGFSKMAGALARQGRALEAFQAQDAATAAVRAGPALFGPGAGTKAESALEAQAGKLADWLAVREALPGKTPTAVLLETVASLDAYYARSAKAWPPKAGEAAERLRRGRGREELKK